MSATTILFGDVLRSGARPWLDQLGKADRDRLLLLLELSHTERIRLSDCLGKLFPNLEPIRALADFTRLRKRINDVASSESLGFRFHVDSKKKNPPSDRDAWFTGPDAAVVRVSNFSEQATQDIQGKTLVASRGISTSSSALEKGKTVVRFFVSYAHEDKSLAETVVRGLQSEFSASKSYELALWIDREIMVGDKWHERILAAIGNCDFGLFMVSPAFLGSSYIGENEIPPFISGDPCKLVIPVGLVPVSFSTHDLKGLQEKQIFFRRGRNNESRTFDAMRQSSDKRTFIHQLYLEIERKLDSHFATVECAIPATQPKSGKQVSGSYGPIDQSDRSLSIDEAADLFPKPEKIVNFMRTKGYAHRLGDREAIYGDAKLAEGNVRDALDVLEDWAIYPFDSPFFALLGEVGIGKTTTLKQLTRQLLEKRRADPLTYPLPIYIDLRDFVSSYPGDVPTIEQLLGTVIERAWRVSDRTVTASDILRLVREEGALIIFDGLDEKIVHLNASRARDFIRTLWSVLPQAMLNSAKRNSLKRSGKLLISCRSHYFRDVWSQNAMLTGEDREGLDRNEYPAFCLLPFDEEQILGYLTSFLGSEGRAKEAVTLIGSIHNLRDLAQRPYLLSLISGRLGDLEAMRLSGETVNAARLYDLVVRSWLNRDDGKHQIEAAHKRRIMEELAADLWKSGEKQWNVDALEDWLDCFLLANAAFREAYINKDRALLKEDLRTATFVLRPDAEEQSFRFAHTSLQEYFLACHLLRALRDGIDGAWDLPMVSTETLDFLGQLIAIESAHPKCLTSLERILGGDTLRSAQIAFQYWLEAIKHDYPEPNPAFVNLSGAEVNDWNVRGRSKDRPLNLRGANLRGIRINRTRVDFVDARGADLTGMESRQAVFCEVDLSNSILVNVDLAGLKWRGGRLLGADFAGTKLEHAEIFRVESDAKPDFQSVSLPETLSTRLCSVFRGHSSSVMACEWSPDGRLLLSGSNDKALKVWDSETGTERLTLSGHENSVRACAWSPGGRHVLSASDDKTLKVWDPETGEECLTLFGHDDSVRACAWSPDGRHVISGSDDKTLKVWDAETGEECLTLFGHEDSVTACAWSPDGRLILSGSYDRTLKVWDAETGEERLTLSGHEDSVRACAWSPDGRNILSGSEDRTAAVWDAESGEERLTLSGHEDSVGACAWSPDGRRIISGSDDTTIIVWDADTGAEWLTISGHTNAVRGCAWSPDGRRIISGSDDKSLKVWDAETGAEWFTLPGSDSAVTACAWSPDGRRILSGSWDKSLKVWDAESGEEWFTLAGHAKAVWACAWSPDGRRLLSGSWDKSLKVWDAETGAERLAFSNSAHTVMACAWSPDGRRVLSGGLEKSLKVWDAETGEERLNLSGHGYWIWTCAWSPNGRRVLAGSDDKTLKIWDAETGAELRTLSGHVNSAMACAWSPEGSRIVSGSLDKTLKVWDAETGEELFTFSGHEKAVWACAWSPDGRTVLSGSTDKTLKIWDAESGEERLTLFGHEDSVRACAWSPDGRRILSGSDDNSVKVWDAENGVCIWTGYHLPEQNFVAISGDGERILAASRESWRWVGWKSFDAEGRFLQRLPLETFGPIPWFDPRS